MKKDVPIKKYFTIVMESHTKIMKVVSLANNLIAKMSALCTDHIIKTREKVIPKVLSYNQYEYITEKQYKDILTELTTTGVFDFSANGIPNTLLESADVLDSIKKYGAKYSKTITMPILEDSLYCNNADLQLEYQKLYKHYEYIIKVVLADALESGIKMNKFQMTQLNTIHKVIKKKVIFGATQKPE